jgi:hypothetical protein
VSEIGDLLESGLSSRGPGESSTPSEVAALVQHLQAPLPPEYLEFLTRGGLAELRFSNRVLGPVSILKESQWVEGQGLVPMGSDGCGNLYCWRKGELPESRVYLWDHESGEVTPAFPSFVDALRSWRF